MPSSKVRPGSKTGLDASESVIYDNILLHFCRSCEHPDKAVLIDAILRKDYAYLLSWTELPSPQCYDSASRYLLDVQIAALIKKYPFSNAEIPGLSPEKQAKEKFLASEHRCKRVNQRFRARRLVKRQYNPQKTFFWGNARRYIEMVIGVKPNLPSILAKCDFTAGASMGVHGNTTNLARKFFAADWTCTPSALPYAITALWTNIHARDCILPGAVKCYDPDLFRGLVYQKVKRVSCNKISFVPKTAKTHRTIAVEPLLNGFVQKGVEIELLQKLKKFNIDLRDQTPNRALAFAGSLGSFNPYCTIDLSAASDSIAIEVVRDLLPPEWFEFLADIRAPRFSLDDEDSHYEKFCSMGNGFCFPLQTLIYASVCYASLLETGGPSENFSVYGDDIIIPQNEALLVIERLRDIGFKVNSDKTFITGPFRESCGRDWYNGQDVRPVSIKRRITDIRHAIAFHNSTWRSRRVADLFVEVRAYLLTLRPHLLRPGVEPGDTAFSVPLDQAMVSPWVRWNRTDSKWSWREILTPVQNDSKVCMPITQRDNAVLYAVLRGANSSKPFPVRYSTRARASIVSRPFWERVVDAFGDGNLVSLDFSRVEPAEPRDGV